LADTYVGYFNLLAAKSRLAIEFDNFNVSKRNLELAKVKVRLGSANNADVFRWESELALAQQGVIDAQTTLQTFKLQLNVLLGNVLEQDFDIEDVKIDDEVYDYFKQGDLNDMVSNPADVEVLSDFLVMEAVASHPAKKEFLENFNAVQRQHSLNKRAFYLPSFALQGEFNRVFNRAGKGSDPPDLGGGFNDNTWFIGVGISYPLFDGSRRFVKKQQTHLQLEQLEIGRLNLDQNLEIGVRSRILQLVSASTNTEFSSVAADNSLKSFDLVQDKYREGVVPIVTLIDAQKAAFQAKLDYDISIYDFLIAHLQLEYSIGLFSMLANPDDIEDLRQRFFEYNNENR
jgi:outer membrane protein TolC